MTKPAYLVFSGSGPLLPCHVGFYDAVCRKYHPVGAAGTSGGGAMALAVCSGMSITDVQQLCIELFTRGDLLDLSLWPFNRFGIYKGEKILGALQRIFGNMRMCDLIMPCRVIVCDLWARKTVVVSNESHPLVKVCDAAYATMAVPIAFRAARLSKSDKRLYVDGGASANFAMSTFDHDRITPTIGSIIRGKKDDEVRPVNNLADYAAALFDLRSDAANDSMKSSKANSLVVTIETSGSILDFKQTPEQVQALCQEGYSAAREQLNL